MNKYFFTMILIFIFCQPSFAAEAEDLNKKVIQVRHQIDDVKLSLAAINLKLTDLDRETIRMKNNELHSVDSSDFLIIDKTVLCFLLIFCVGAGVVIWQIFFGFKRSVDL